MIDSSKEDHYQTALLEDMNDKFSLILEVLEQMMVKVTKIDGMDRRLINVESDVKVIKAVVTDHSRQLNSHQGRITNLEHHVYPLS